MGAEAIGGDQRPGARLPQDVTDLTVPVDVDDGHDHHAELQQPVEGRRGLGPVGELERDDVAGTDPAGGEQAGEERTLVGQLADGSLVRAHRRQHAGASGAVVGQTARHEDRERVVVPQALGVPAAA